MSRILQADALDATATEEPGPDAARAAADGQDGVRTVPSDAREIDPDHDASGHEPAPAGLTEVERAVLDFEAANPRQSSRKDEEIRRRFGRSVARYYQILGTLIEAPAALEYDPVLIARLRRLRDARAAGRDVRRLQRRESAAPRLDKAR